MAVEGNPNPVTLVRIVVTRKTSVHPSRPAPASRPPTTTRPAMSPSTLMAT